MYVMTQREKIYRLGVRHDILFTHVPTIKMSFNRENISEKFRNMKIWYRKLFQYMIFFDSWHKLSKQMSSLPEKKDIVQKTLVDIDCEMQIN